MPGTQPIEKQIETNPAVAHAVNESVPTGDGGGRAPTRYEQGRRAEEIAKRSHKKKAQSSGVGESRTFAAEPGAFEQTIDWSELTLNGQPIPEHLWAQLPYAMTDQGAAEANAGKEPRRVEVLREEPLGSRPADELLRTMNERSIEQSVAQYRESLDLMMQEDPLKVLVERHTPLGHRGRWMSDRTTGTSGMRRAGLDYEPVLVDGKRVQHGGGFIASVPEEMAKAAEAIFAKKGRDLTAGAVTKVQEQTEQVMSEAGIRRQNRRGDLPEGGMEFLEPGAEGGMLNGTIGTTFKG